MVSLSDATSEVYRDIDSILTLIWSTDAPTIEASGTKIASIANKRFASVLENKFQECIDMPTTSEAHKRIQKEQCIERP